MPYPDPQKAVQILQYCKLEIDSVNFGQEPKILPRNEAVNVYGLRVDRRSLCTASIGLMIRDFVKTGKCSLEDIFDPNKLQEERKVYGKMMQDAYLGEDKAALGLLLEDAYRNGIESITDYVQGRYTKNFTPADLLKPENRHLYTMIYILMDADQEMEAVLSHGMVHRGGDPEAKFQYTEEENRALVARGSGVCASYIAYVLSLQNLAAVLAADPGNPKLVGTSVEQLRGMLLPYLAQTAHLKKLQEADANNRIDDFAFSRGSAAAITDVQNQLERKKHDKLLTDILSDPESAEVFCEMLQNGQAADKFFKVTKDKTEILSPHELRSEIELAMGKLLPSHLTELRDKFEELRAQVRSIGTTDGDTTEYRNFLTAFEEVAGIVERSDDPIEINQSLSRLKDAATPYYDAKLSISQGSRQAKRFALVDEVIHLQDPEMDEEMRLSVSIAKKGILGRVSALAESSDPRERAFVEKYASDPAALDRYARKLAASHEFRLKAGLSVKTLRSTFRKTPQELANIMYAKIPAKTMEKFRAKTEKQPLPANDVLFTNVASILDNHMMMPEAYGLPELLPDAEFGLSADRTALSVMAIGKLLKDGHSLDDILDPSKLQEERKAAGAEVLEHFKKGGSGTLGTYAARMYLRVLNKASDYLVSKISGDLTTNSFLQPDMKNVLLVKNIMYDAQQEITRKKVRALADKLEGVDPEDLDFLLKSTDSISNRLSAYSNVFKQAQDLYNFTIPEGSDRDLALSNLAGEVLTNGLGGIAEINASRERQLLTPKEDFSDAHNFENTVQFLRSTAPMAAAMNEQYAALQENVEQLVRDKDSRIQLARNLLDPDIQKKLVQVDDSVLTFDQDDLMDPLNTHELIHFENISNLQKNCEPEDISKLSDKEFYARVSRVCTTPAQLWPEYYGLDRGGVVSTLENPNGFSVGREALASMSIGVLLRRGYSFDQIFNDGIPEAIRREAGQEVLRHFENTSKEENAKFAVGVYEEIFRKSKAYLEGAMPVPLKTEDLLRSNQKNLVNVTYAMMDAGQEIERIKTLAEEVLGKEKYDKYLNEQSAISNLIGGVHMKILDGINMAHTGIIEEKKAEPYRITGDLVSKTLPIAGALLYARQVENKDPGLRFDYNTMMVEYAPVLSHLSIGIMDMDFSDELEDYLNESQANREKFSRALLNPEALERFFTLKDGIVEFGGDPLAMLKPLEEQHYQVNSKAVMDTALAAKQLKDGFTARSFWGLPDAQTGDKIEFQDGNITDERTVLTSLSFAYLVNHGYEIDQILDPANGDLRKFGTQAVAMQFRMGRIPGRGDDFAKFAAENYAALVAKCQDYLDEKAKNGLQPQDMFKPEMKNFMTVRFMMGDAAQTLEKRLTAFTKDIPGFDQMMRKEMIMSTALSHLGYLFDYASDMINLPEKNESYDKFTVGTALPRLASVMEVDAMVNGGKGKKLSELTPDQINVLDSLSEDVKEQLKDQMSFVGRQFGGNAMNARLLGHGILSGRIGNALFKIDSEKQPSSTFDRETRENVVDSNIEIQPLEVIFDKSRMTRDFAPDPVEINDPEPVELKSLAQERAETERQRKAEPPASDMELDVESPAMIWFSSLKDQLAQTGFDLNSPMDTARLKEFSIEMMDKPEEVNKLRIRTDMNYALNPTKSGVYDFENLRSGRKALNQLEEKDILALYQLAQDGRLALSDKDGIAENLRGIYAADNYSAGISTTAKEMSGSKNPQEHFPGCDKAQEYFDNLTRFDYGRSIAEDLFGLKSEQEIFDARVKDSWEAAIRQDLQAHPYFYVDAQMAQRRSDLILNTQMVAFNYSGPDKADRQKMFEEHQTDYEADIENILFNVAKETFPEDLAKLNQEPDPVKQQFMRNSMISSLLASNLVGGSGTIFQQEKGKNPWDAIDSIINHVLTDKEVFVYRPDGKPYQIVMGGADEAPKLKKTPANTMNLAQCARVAELLKAYKQKIEDIGLTDRDSDEFTRMREALDKTIKNVESHMTTIPEKAFKDLRETANKYYLAKVDQSQNSRRSQRFDIADQLRNFGTAPRSAEERMRYSIAAKAVKTYARILNTVDPAKEKGLTLDAAKAIKENANKVLTNPNDFNDAVENLMRTDHFKSLCENKNLAQLRKEFDKKPSSLMQQYIIGKSDPVKFSQKDEKHVEQSGMEMK